VLGVQVLASVNGVVVMSFHQAMSLIKGAGRPLTLTFSPDRDHTDATVLPPVERASEQPVVDDPEELASSILEESLSAALSEWIMEGHEQKWQPSTAPEPEPTQHWLRCVLRAPVRAHRNA
jgi:hypothetical protein